MASSITQVDNCCAWCPVIGRYNEFPNLIECGRDHYRNSQPGMLVWSYSGHKHLESTGVLGLGMIVAVMPHPEPHGDVLFLCLVLWNFDYNVYPS